MEEIYRDYVAYCERIGVQPMTFEDWQAQSAKDLKQFSAQMIW